MSLRTEQTARAASGFSSPVLSHAEVARLAKACAPTSPAPSLTSIAEVESGLAPLTIGLNETPRQTLKFADREATIRTAETLIAEGRNIDLGLAQINSRNLGWLGLSARDAFDPCHNLAAAARVLERGYAQALSAGRPGRPILQMAYSVYNSGDTNRGVVNGYAGKVEAARHRAAQ